MLNHQRLNRRDLLKLAGGGAACLMTPSLARASGGFSWPQNKTFVLFKMDGGNDGLNTIIPYTEQLYYTNRPTLAIKSGYAFQDNRFAFHPSLAPLVPAWSAKDMMVALGVGYPNMVDSHFKGSDIWNTAITSEDTPQTGWVDRLFSKADPDLGLPYSAGPFDAAAVTGGFAEPFLGPDLRFVTSTVQTDPSLPSNALNPGMQSYASANPVYDWMYQTQNELDVAASVLHSLPVITRTTFPTTALGISMAHAANLIAHKLNVPFIFLNQSTYDTHSDQLTRQAALLTDFANCVAAFRAEMIVQGLWKNVVLMTYSEFGRNAYENSAKGTDHGLANAEFIFGGAVKGGYVGGQFPLSSLNPKTGQTALPYQLDFRQLYATILQGWFGAPGTVSSALFDSAVYGSFAPLPIFG
jgi:uncharacterized protein (DUF1501 family)